jgi:hypothetical protein
VAAKLAAQGESLAGMAAWDETEYEAKIGAALEAIHQENGIPQTGPGAL